MEHWTHTYLRHVLATRGWNMKQLADKCGVAPSTINRPLRGDGYHYELSLGTLQKIEAASGIRFEPFRTTVLAETAEAFSAAPTRIAMLLPINTEEPKQAYKPAAGRKENAAPSARSPRATTMIDRDQKTGEVISLQIEGDRVIISAILTVRSLDTLRKKLDAVEAQFGQNTSS